MCLAMDIKCGIHTGNLLFGILEVCSFACSDIKLKTYAMLLAGTGMRATEALSIRIKDLDLKSNPAKVFVRGEYTKTRIDRMVFLSEEITHQLISWLSYKYRTRRVCHNDAQTGKTITEI